MDRFRLSAPLWILVVGITLRLALAWVNPPSNSYDDHRRPIAEYANSGERPAPDACWQCYQPPVYYEFSAFVLKGMVHLTGSPWVGWRAVQFLSAAASGASLVLVYFLVRLFLPGNQNAQAAGVLIVAILPRDLYTAASISNDAMLQLFVTGAALFAALFLLKRDGRQQWWLIGLAVLTLMASATKQSGLVLLPIVGIASLKLMRAAPPAKHLRFVLLVVSGLSLLSLADEAWRFERTGRVLASNQHLDYRALAEQQPPGLITARTFTTFMPHRLVNAPTLGPMTVGSFWTQIFARTWFDYEPRFLPENRLTLWLARMLYAVGLLSIAVALVGVARLLMKARRSAGILLLIPAGFLGAAIVQTVRFPHFSSMKALFVLPATSLLALSFAFGIDQCLQRPLMKRAAAGLLIALALVGLAHVAAALSLNSEALGSVTSPQWPDPHLVLDSPL
jgi:4-amino-4-deoxy-L-arabinose transferase-like glycosyltransferase